MVHQLGSSSRRSWVKRTRILAFSCKSASRVTAAAAAGATAPTAASAATGAAASIVAVAVAAAREGAAGGFLAGGGRPDVAALSFCPTKLCGQRKKSVRQ